MNISILGGNGFNKSKVMYKLLNIPEISLKPPIVFKKKDGGGGGIREYKFENFNETNDFLEEKLMEYVQNHIN
ncbi:hypothetical protein [Tepidibacter aestuarii]|uniref:hypothetical protein n=1 Tax=Tepidibacter aestuarii TaxID=2925782 RepID=UPI0020BFD1A2|nr:hypothetical protein [Tepidibacter aestuarii]CAH2213433.1 protein of unknown function [Tepidibacter aestuarii]